MLYADEEEEFCTCGTGHGSGEGHTEWCKWLEVEKLLQRTEWRPIETAPLGDDDFYLVCCNDPADDRSPFVVRGSIFASARKHPVTHHLSLAHLTHWMPLPEKPATHTSGEQSHD